jgi:hypothetical protein
VKTGAGTGSRMQNPLKQSFMAGFADEKEEE